MDPRNQIEAYEDLDKSSDIINIFFLVMNFEKSNKL